jgi:hypothetical protein
MHSRPPPSSSTNTRMSYAHVSVLKIDLFFFNLTTEKLELETILKKLKTIGQI